jgi:hypothetical protein
MSTLRAERSGYKMPFVARFSSTVNTGPGTHPATFTMDIRSYPGTKRLGGGVDLPRPSRAEIKGRLHNTNSQNAPF